MDDNNAAVCGGTGFNARSGLADGDNFVALDRLSSAALAYTMPGTTNTFYILVTGYNTAQGQYQLNVTWASYVMRAFNSLVRVGKMKHPCLQQLRPPLRLPYQHSRQTRNVTLQRSLLVPMATWLQTSPPVTIGAKTLILTPSARFKLRG
jgi:hypothetical protein